MQKFNLQTCHIDHVTGCQALGTWSRKLRESWECLSEGEAVGQEKEKQHQVQLEEIKKDKLANSVETLPTNQI